MKKYENNLVNMLLRHRAIKYILIKYDSMLQWWEDEPCWIWRISIKAKVTMDKYRNDLVKKMKNDKRVKVI